MRDELTINIVMYADTPTVDFCPHGTVLGGLTENMAPVLVILQSDIGVLCGCKQIKQNGLLQ